MIPSLGLAMGRERTVGSRGFTAVVGAEGDVVGVYTDGDLRRTLDLGLDPHTTSIREVMTVGGKSIRPNALAAEAANLMERHAIQGLLVIDEAGELVGALACGACGPPESLTSSSGTRARCRTSRSPRI